MNEKFNSSEIILVGAWISLDGQVVADAVSKRIEYLTQNAIEEHLTCYTDNIDGLKTIKSTLLATLGKIVF
jgi:hypothetical protein